MWRDWAVGEMRDYCEMWREAALRELGSRHRLSSQADLRKREAAWTPRWAVSRIYLL